MQENQRNCFQNKSISLNGKELSVSSGLNFFLLRDKMYHIIFTVHQEQQRIDIMSLVSVARDIK